MIYHIITPESERTFFTRAKQQVEPRPHLPADVRVCALVERIFWEHFSGENEPLSQYSTVGACLAQIHTSRLLSRVASSTSVGDCSRQSILVC